MDLTNVSSSGANGMLATAANVFGKRSAIEQCMHPPRWGTASQVEHILHKTPVPRLTHGHR